MKYSRVVSFFLLLVIIGVSLSIMACKSDTSSPGNTGGGGGGGSKAFGSGTISMTVSGSNSGTFNFSGAGTWPPGPSGVAAGIDSTHKILNVIGYTRTALSKATAAKYTFVALVLSDSTGLSARSYTDANIVIGVNIDTTKIDSLGYVDTTGTVTIDTIVGNHVTLHFNGIALRPSDSSIINVKNGKMTVNAKTGLFLSTPTTGGGGGGETDTSGKSGSGSFSFNSNKGNFSASGAWDTSAHSSNSQVGAWRDTTSGKDDLSIYAVNYLSSDTVDVSILLFHKTGDSLATGSYAFPAEATFGYGRHVNPRDTAALLSGYVLSNGTVALDSLTTRRARGAFSGTGFKYNDITQTISVTSGGFSVNYAYGKPSISSQSSPQIEMFIRGLIARSIRK